jgi:HEAT repeat protein
MKTMFRIAVSVSACVLAGTQCSGADSSPPQPVLVEQVTQIPKRTTAGLGTVFYKPSTAEAPFFNRLTADEKSPGGRFADYDITKKAGTYVGWFGIVRGVAEDQQKQTTTLTVEHKYFDGLTDAHIMAVSFNGSGDFQAVVPGTGHKLEQLSLVRIYGTVAASTGKALPRLDAVFVRDWHWGTFTFIEAYGKQRGSEAWRKLNQSTLNDIYDPDPTDEYYRARLGDRLEDIARRNAFRERLLKAARAARPESTIKFEAFVDALIQQDETKRDRALDDIFQTRAFAALSRVMAEALKADDAHLRSQAAETLGNLEEFVTPTAVSALIDALHDRDGFVRWKAAEALGKVGAPAQAALPFLIAATKESDAAVRALAVNALGKIGARPEEIVPTLIAAATDTDSHVRYMTASTLGEVGHPASPALGTLIELLKHDRDLNVPWIAAQAIGRVDPDGRLGVPALTEALKSRNGLVRRFAAKGLAAIGPGASAALPGLESLLKDRDPGVRVAAAEAVLKVGHNLKSALPVLCTVLESDDGFSPMWAALVITDTGPAAKEAVPSLRKAVKHKNPNVRESAAQALGKIGPPGVDAVPDLVARLGDESCEVRSAAAEALWNINQHPRAIPQLIHELKLEPTWGQNYSAEAIGRIGAPAAEAMPLLEKLRYSRDRWVRAAANESLKQLAPAGK